ncbi:hypothetical protein F2Q68_00041547 [Brassica cretica]|uniref:CTLH domain-containing protein n=1 Tax=Brassica cretica TaxID=69181 RepID=A0A8S9MCX2_BRACR|nr:hypothetical protein F2Q68_00041547 [Brassica cretica]
MEIDDPVTNGNTDAVMTESTPPFTPSPPVPASRLSQLTESLKLEHQLLRVPFEHYKKTIRANHRYLEKEVTSVVSSVGDLADNNWSKDVTVSRLTSLVSRLQGLKRKLEEGSNVENLQAQRCRARIDNLDSADAENITEWNNTKLKRILVDYMLRMSYFETASKLSESCNILDLVDIDIFREAKKVIDALKRREVASALAWCADNKTRLKKSKVSGALSLRTFMAKIYFLVSMSFHLVSWSKFEFQLRLQEFIELVRADSYKQAIRYARKHLTPWGATHMNELQRVLATLAFKNESQVQGIAERYSKLTHDEKQKKSTNLSKFCNKKMHDEKKRFPIKFSQKVQELEGSLVGKLPLLQDILLREDQSIMSEQNHNFPNYSSVPDHQQQSESATSTEQDMSRGDVYDSAAATDQLLNHQSKYSIFLFNHENASFTQLPHSVSSSLQQTYYNNLSDNRALLGGQGFNFGFGNNNVSTALPEEQVNFGYYNNSLNFGYDFNNLCT